MSTEHRSSTETLIAALQILARDMGARPDAACIAEAAERLREQEAAIEWHCRNDEACRDCSAEMARIRELEAELAELRKDKARLDAVLMYAVVECHKGGKQEYIETRGDIDSWMACSGKS
jgi:hypothetical protein